MFDTNIISKRHFPVTLHLENGKEIKLAVEPPKLKVLRRLAAIVGNKENEIDEMIWAMTAVLNKNKTGYIINEDDVEAALNTDEMSEFLRLYFNWVGKVSENPN